MNDRQKLLRIIQIYDFSIKELNLYLDTHPGCAAALQYYQKYKELRNKAYEQYIRQYGPITTDQVTSTEQWTWINSPWPWERSAN
ncbi:MAG: spore coat protein CotJB [Clostridiales bacterium]|jgi:spore coat protein JB|nr:spore coat protein CotJB [Clostridiales bacterium]